MLTNLHNNNIIGRNEYPNTRLGEHTPSQLGASFDQKKTDMLKFWKCGAEGLIMTTCKN
jgi:hypothetical protein